MLAMLAIAGCDDAVETDQIGQALAYQTAAATDVSILSRGGGNGETARTDPELGVWTLTGSSGYTSEALIKFNVSLPTGARVTSATLKLVFANWATGFTVRGRYLARPWNASSSSLGWLYRDTGLTWTQAGARGDGTDAIAGKSFALTGWSGSGTETKTIPLDVAVVQSWVDSATANQGVLLFNETSNAVTRIYSSRHANAAYRPSLDIQYTTSAGGADAGVVDAPAADTTRPSVTVTSPTSGATLSGTVTLSATASDNVGVAGVQFLVDGVAAGAEDTTAPYSVSFATIGVSNGAHTFSARARDAAGNTTTSASISATVSNSTPGQAVTTSFRQGTNNYSGNRAVSILSRGGGNGEVDTTGTQLGVWTLTGSSGYTSEALIKFDALNLPSGARVTAASLRLVFPNWETNFIVRGYYLRNSWNHAAATLGWLYRDTGLSWSVAGARGAGTDLVSGASFELSGWSGSGSDVKTISLDPAVVQTWVDTPAANQGVLLVNETNDRVTRVWSPRASTSTNRPLLTITYTTGTAGGDASPPAVAMTRPTDGSTVTGTLDLSATASDNVGVVGLQFLVDGTPMGAELTGAGSLTVDSRNLGNGTHTFAARARDAAGNTATASVSATVSNAPGISARTANPTCAPPPRSTSSTPGSLGLVAAFPNLSTGSGGPFTNRSPIVARRVRMPQGEWLWFIGLRNGRVFQLSSTSASTLPSANLIDPMIPDSRDLSIGEEGFLGLAFDPDIATNASRNHVYYVRAGWGSVGLYRADVSRNASGIYVTSNHVMVLSAGGGGHHYGGDLQFGPDGYLYMSVGEDDIGARARSTANLRGKILRIDVHSTTPLAGKLYGIPATNPYRLSGSTANAACYEYGDSGLPDASHPCPEVYARGFRNPYRFSFDRSHGQLWVGDVGAEHEEVDVVTLGGDYGWNTQEGTTTPGGGIQAAVTELPRNDASCAGNAVIGGFVYRGTAISWLTGQYLAADNGTGKIYAYHPTNRTLTMVASRSCSQFNPASFTEDELGELYVVALNPGTGLGVFKLVGTGSTGTSGGPAETLSATGCVQPSNPWQPIAAAVPYAVNSELWSDGLTKQRWMILPDGATISASGNGDWTFPVGTVLIKQFSFGSRRIETRFLVRHADDGDWTGYAYVWNSAQTDATLRLAGESVDLGDGGAPWRVPSSVECLNCHTVAKGRSLGLETRQLNRTFTYPSGVTANQLSTLAYIGLLDSTFREPRSFAAFPSPSDNAAPIAARARAYLHSNCSHCHPAAGSNPNLLYDTSLSAMNLCGVAPSPAIPGATSLIVPGNATQSGLNLRMKHLGSLRMPKLGSARVDSAGTAVVDAWVNGLTTCTGP